jgi:hypothetical protein
MSTTLATFDIGIRTRIDENTVYHGSGWYNADGSLKLNIGPRTSYTVRDGRTTVWHDGRKAW